MVFDCDEMRDSGERRALRDDVEGDGRENASLTFDVSTGAENEFESHAFRLIKINLFNR